MRLFILSLLAALLAAPGAAEPVRVGMIVDGPWAGNDGIRQLTINEILALTEGEFDVEFPDSAYLVGDWSFDEAKANLERLLEDPEVDLVIAWGLLASYSVCCSGDLSKPVIAPVIIDPKLQGVPILDGASGVTNLSFVALPDNLARELRIFREVVQFRHVAILANRFLLEAIPELGQRTEIGFAGMNLDFEYVPVETSADSVLAALSEKVDAVYVWPQLQMPRAELEKLVRGLNARKLPSFSALGSQEVEAGMFASAVSSDFFPRLARRIALNTQRILLGEPPGSIPVAFSMRDELVINMRTAREIEVSPRWDVLTEAELLYEQELDGLLRETLGGAVQKAIDANLDIVAQRFQMAAGEQEVARARSLFRPELGLGADGVLIDDDRAAASFGSQAERTWTGSLSLSQLLYSDGALANLEIQRRLQDARGYDVEALRLDIALEAAVTYLNLLRAKSLESVERNNLRLTRSNLELARIRRSIGAANPAEVYRWESQIAIDRKALIDASADVRVAEIALNRLLHRDLGERFLTEEVGLEDPSLITGQKRFTGYTETPRNFAVFRRFLVQDGLTAAPELQQLDAAIAAGERAVVAARRAFWAPEIGLQASLEEVLSESGEGSSSSDFGLALPLADDTSWSLGLAASLPLFDGGSRRADRLRAEAELAELETRFNATVERIEQRILASMELTRASYSGISLSEKAAVAARQNLELVADAYARGAVQIIDLLDAQNAALNAEQLAANAAYDFFIDLMEVQRSANRFDFFLSPEARDQWFERLDRFFADAGVEPLRDDAPASNR